MTHDEAELFLPAQRPELSPLTRRADGGARMGEPAEVAEMVETVELTELGRGSGGSEAGGVFGGSEGSGLGVHLLSAGGDSRSRGVMCAVCLVETWNICALCDDCHGECRLAR